MLYDRCMLTKQNNEWIGLVELRQRIGERWRFAAWLMLIVMCIVGMWLFQILEDIGMTCGLMPITGIPLPFMSYGSSFMIVNFALLGFMGSVWTRGKQNTRRASYATSH